ncbi:MAG: thiamine-phosphate kinase, partial [Gammaproteobacteria bacterium]
RFFRDCGATRADVVLGVGDDGALLRPPPGTDLVAVSDTLVEGVHFLVGSPAGSIGHRALAVNLSDIAAMGATPRWALLSLTLPQVEEAWLAGFARGFGALARAHGVALVGGDTTRGPMTLGVQVLGTVPTGEGLRRSGGRPGDALFVTGTPCDAAAGLALIMATAGAMADSGVAGLRRDAPADALEALRQRFLFPTPRIAEGEALRGLASACIDISDGLVGDLGKLAAASACAAVLDIDALPRSAALAAGFAPEAALRLICDGGDDYELLLAVPPAHIARVAAMPGLTRIGELREASTAARVTLRRRAADGTLSETPAVQAGFDHFAG